MEVKFNLAQINGEKVTDMARYEATIFRILADCSDEYDEATIGEDWFSVTKMPTLDAILEIERELVKLGFVIEAWSRCRRKDILKYILLL